MKALEGQLHGLILGNEPNKDKKAKEKQNEKKQKSAFVKNTYLDLSGKGLTQFNAEEYAQFSDIKYLYLKNNKLKTLDENIFKVFSNLVWLDARNNELKKIPSSIIHAKHLTQILLENNNLQELPKEIGSLKHLRGVQLRGNPLLSPLRETIEEGQGKVLEHLRKCWSELSGIPLETILKECEAAEKTRNISILKRQSSLYGARPSEGNISDFYTERVRNAILEQEKYLQKKRDIEVLKQWRKTYMLAPKVGSKEAPPFEMDERYTTMVNRKDLKNQRMKSPPRKLPKKKVDVNAEISQIKKSLLDVKSKSFSIPENPEDFQALKFSKANEISKLTELQKRLEDLRMKH